MPEDLNATQVLLTLIFSVLGSTGVGALLLRFVKLQMDEARSNLANQETLRGANEGLLDIIIKLSSGIFKRNDIQQKGIEEQINALRLLTAALDQTKDAVSAASQVARQERTEIKSDTSALIGSLRQAHSKLDDTHKLVEEIRSVLNAGQPEDETLAGAVTVKADRVVNEPGESKNWTAIEAGKAAAP